MAPGVPPARASRLWVAALYLVLVAVFAAGIWGSYRAAFPGRGLYRATGLFEARWGESMILVRHDSVPGLMDEMPSMSLLVESKALLDRAALQPGDRIRLTIRQAPEALVVVDIEKIR